MIQSWDAADGLGQDCTQRHALPPDQLRSVPFRPRVAAVWGSRLAQQSSRESETIDSEATGQELFTSYVLRPVQLIAQPIIGATFKPNSWPKGKASWAYYLLCYAALKKCLEEQSSQSGPLPPQESSPLQPQEQELVTPSVDSWVIGLPAVTRSEFALYLWLLRLYHFMSSWCCHCRQPCTYECHACEAGSFLQSCPVAFCRWLDADGISLGVTEFKNVTAVDFSRTPEFVRRLEQLRETLDNCLDRLVMEQKDAGLKKVQRHAMPAAKSAWKPCRVQQSVHAMVLLLLQMVSLCWTAWCGLS